MTQGTFYLNGGSQSSYLAWRFYWFFSKGHWRKKGKLPTHFNVYQRKAAKGFRNVTKVVSQDNFKYTDCFQVYPIFATKFYKSNENNCIIFFQAMIVIPLEVCCPSTVRKVSSNWIKTAMLKCYNSNICANWRMTCKWILKNKQFFSLDVYVNLCIGEFHFIKCI